MMLILLYKIRGNYNLKKVYLPIIAAMIATPTGNIVSAEELTKTEEQINTEEVVEVDNSEEWLEDVVEIEPVEEEVVVEEGYENLGPLIYKSSAISSKIAANNEGDYFIYYIMHGSPAALVVVDYETKEIVHTFTLEDSKSAWGLDVDENGKLWIGGSVASVLYSYDPNTEEFEKHGSIFSNKSDTSIQDLIVSGNKVYEGSAYGGSLVAYDTETKEIEEFGQIRKRKEFVKAIVADEETGEIFVSLEKKEDNDNNVNYALVTVRDTGEGIDPEIFPKIFSKFITKSFEGIGLGLYISKYIVEAHGGKILAENNIDGKGATFSFSLPLFKSKNK